MEIETFTMHLDFEHTFSNEDDEAGVFIYPITQYIIHVNMTILLSRQAGGRLQLHALDPTKQHTLPVYNNSGLAGFEAGLEEVSFRC